MSLLIYLRVLNYLKRFVVSTYLDFKVFHVLNNPGDWQTVFTYVVHDRKATFEVKNRCERIRDIS